MLSESEHCEPTKVYSKNCFLEFINLDDLDLNYPFKELYYDEFNLQTFCEGLKGSEDNSCKKMRDKRP